MRRRDFIILFGATAAAWPLAARAQQPTLPAVGYLHVRSAADAPHLAQAFRTGLQESGFIEGQNVKIEFRWADGQYKRLPALAKELTQIPVAVIVAAGGELAAEAAEAANSSIPLVFSMSGDPVKLGLAESFNQPGRNATGMNILTATMEPKRLGLLHELVPDVTAVAALVDPGFPEAEKQMKDFQEAAPHAGLKLHIFRIDPNRELEATFETIAREQIGAIAVASSPVFDTHRSKIIALAAHYALPAIYHFREYPESGGLISYGIDIREVHRQLGRYTGQILRGAKPGELPIMLPSKFELVINLKTAKVLGLKVPTSMQMLADDVIE
jgi:putative tryptophan/tyrosine transport system substrate-binding protein